MKDPNCIVVLGATASGKTNFACKLALSLNGEIISMDSRQVYRRLDIGTGKDLKEYTVDGQKINFHLIDICEPQKQFYLHEFIAELKSAFENILLKNKIPILCGGTGLYLDTLRKDFSFTQIKENETLRNELIDLSKEELIEHLQKFHPQHIKHVDLNSKKRLIRGIEVAASLSEYPIQQYNPAEYYKPIYIGIQTTPALRKEKIHDRLMQRMEQGLIEEVESLILSGITHQRLEELGLEYKFISLYLRNKLLKTEMLDQLQTAIIQYSKRQMTWFRKMEKEGVKIKWQADTLNFDLLVGELKIAFKK